MATFLFNDIIFGPVESRRLGVSLGVNLLPEDYKYCTYDCLYCECGWTINQTQKLKLHTREEIKQTLAAKLLEMKSAGKAPNSITFAGNGEPTIHPDFEGIIDDTIALRNQYFPSAIIAVLSNATQIHKQSVINALLKVDQNILKLDSAIESTYQVLNRPKAKLDVPTLVERMKVFEGQLYIQTMLIKGHYKGEFFDNTTEEEVSAWIDLLHEVKPKMVMIYPIARDTPHQDLEKIPPETMQAIGARVKAAGFEVNISS
jgi:wyosine [tRNA(Phe)-imidazoG37] synthetase (radical SAM superfamily)